MGLDETFKRLTPPAVNNRLNRLTADDETVEEPNDVTNSILLDGPVFLFIINE